MNSINFINNGYYDLVHNRVTVRGFSYSDDRDDSKILVYPRVISNIYSISKEGNIYSVLNNTYISWSVRNNLPYVNLSCMSGESYVLEPFYIKDLMAYNYIANASDYIERGCHAYNIDGNPMNCRYDNIVYIDPNKDY